MVLSDGKIRLFNRIFQHRIFGGKGKLFALSVLVGVITTFAVVALKVLAQFFHRQTAELAQIAPWMQWVVPAFPAVGILFCIVFVRFILRRDKYVKSLDMVIQSTTEGHGKIPFHHSFAHIITSGVAVGLGGSAGLEAPSALTGSAIGSNIARWLKLSRESCVLLLACGGSAGIAAVFNSPIAGTLFACEILLPSMSLPALAPLLMSSAAATLLASWLYTGPQFLQTAVQWKMANVPYYVLLGLVAGLVSAYIIKITILVARHMHKLRSVWIRGLVGSIVLYLFFLLFPQLMGEGYQYIAALAYGETGRVTAGILNHPSMLLVLLPLLFLLKPLVSGLTLESGGDGGIFGPSLFCGAMMGYFLYKVLTLCGIPGLTPGVFICTGMGGILAGVMHAPLTGIFLIAELTGGFQLLLPLMIVSGLSCFVSKNLVRYNVYKSMIVEKGGNPEPTEASLILEQIQVHQLMQTDMVTFRQNQRLGELMKIMLEVKQSIYPVVEEDGTLSGIIREEDMRRFVYKETIHNLVLACDLMLPPEPILHSDDTLKDAALFFDRIRCWHLPVCDNGRLVGMLSKADVLDCFKEKISSKAELF